MSFNPTTFKPVTNHLLVRMNRSEEMTKGGLYIPNQFVKDQPWGKVLALGPDVHEIQVGDVVLVDESHGVNVGKNDANQLFNVYLEEDIVAILEPEDKDAEEDC